jgi:hypothetical protein
VGIAFCAGIFVLALQALAASATGQESSTPAPAKAFGSYVGAGCAKPAAADCLLTDGRDRLVISHDKDGSVVAGIKLVFDRGISCRLKVRASWVEDHFLMRAEGIDPAKPCELELLVNGPHVQLQDQGGRCREVYCGAGGAFDGARFRKVRRKKKITPQAGGTHENGSW